MAELSKLQRAFLAGVYLGTAMNMRVEVFWDLFNPYRWSHLVADFRDWLKHDTEKYQDEELEKTITCRESGVAVSAVCPCGKDCDRRLEETASGGAG